MSSEYTTVLPACSTKVSKIRPMVNCFFSLCHSSVTVGKGFPENFNQVVALGCTFYYFNVFSFKELLDLFYSVRVIVLQK